MDVTTLPTMYTIMIFLKGIFLFAHTKKINGNNKRQIFRVENFHPYAISLLFIKPKRYTKKGIVIQKNTVSTFILFMFGKA